MAILPIEAEAAEVRVQDHGALHKGDMRVLAQGGPAAEMLLAKKAKKAVEVIEREY